MCFAASSCLSPLSFCVPAGLDTSTVTSFTTSTALDYEEMLTATATGTVLAATSATAGRALRTGGSLGCPFHGAAITWVQVHLGEALGLSWVTFPMASPREPLPRHRGTLPWGHRGAGCGSEQGQ